ncbi:hypothetical protein HHI36_001694 [Cryptolaemus montrouzieri]|uniref:Ribosomal protein L32 n=1 Tax=Cryptolaemus montrouzieri TaxID=559131 RepID=A0ABD2P933_9CUCU
MPPKKRPNLTTRKGSRRNMHKLLADNHTQSCQVTSSLAVQPLTIVRGSWHQGAARYEFFSSNRQCTANAAVALAYNTVFRCSDWSSRTVDSLLDFGDRLYRKSDSTRRASGYTGNSPYLMVSGVFQIS